MLTFRNLLTGLAFAVLCSPGAWAQGYTITTIAGDNTSGYSGDGAAATAAQLNGPAGLAVDSSGNIYIADALNNVVRVVTGGNISTYAGNSTGGYSGDSGAAANADSTARWAL